MKTILLLLFGFASSLHAQLTIDGFTIDGGGGTSTGAMYTISSTIGQPDAGKLSGGNYAVDGGFWTILSTLQTPGGTSLTVTRHGIGVRVSWPLPATGFVLQQSLSVTGLWSQVPFPYSTNATEISVTVPTPTGREFYRLRNP